MFLVDVTGDYGSYVENTKIRTLTTAFTVIHNDLLCIVNCKQDSQGTFVCSHAVYVCLL